MPWPRGSILGDGDLEALLQEVAQVRFHADIGQHPSKHDPIDPALAELQHEVVGLRTPYLVRTDDDGLPILDVRLEALEPVGPRSGKPVERECATTSKDLLGELAGLQRIVELPAAVRRVEEMRRDEHLVAVLLRRPEDALHVLDRLVLRDTRTDGGPGGPLLAQYVILRIDEHDGGAIPFELHDDLMISRRRAGRR